MTLLKPEIIADVPAPPFDNNLTANLNCSLCSRFVAIQEEMTVLLEPQFNAQSNYLL